MLDGCACREAVVAGVLTLDLGLDIVDGVGRLHLKGDSLARDCGGCQYACRKVIFGIVFDSRVLTKICMVPGQLAVLGLTVADAWSEEKL